MEFKANIEKLTLNNRYYRKVLHTTPQQQLVLMNLKPHEEIGMEKHSYITQFIRVEDGTGKAIINKREYRLKDGDALVIPPNTTHNIIAGKIGLKLYTIYSPPEHDSNTIILNKEDEE
jgi:mannose-6-phosphate isomerase-like protein (cupin superfamily)